MALNIPLPGAPGENLLKGIDTGSSMFARLMHPILAREQQAQAERHFQEELKLRKAAAGRAGANSDLQRKLLELKIKNSDPQEQVKQLLALQNAFGKGGQKETMAGEIPSSMPGINIGQQQLGNEEESQISPIHEEQNNPLQNFIKSVQEQPEAQLNANAVSPYEANQGNKGGLDMEAIAASPILRGWFKKHYGIDPGASSAYTGAAREGIDLARLKKQFGENSEEYRNAKAIEESKEAGRKSLLDIRQRQMGGLKPGDVPIYDPETKEMIGFKKQLTDKERESAKNNVLFNTTYPYVYKGGAVFAGPGATLRLEKAFREAKTNPKARKEALDFMIAEKALTNTMITEAARFQAGRTNQTYNRYAESLKAEDIQPKIKKWIKEFNVPPSLVREAGEKWQKILNHAESKANRLIPATRSYYYDPEKQFKHEEEQKALEAEQSSEGNAEYTDEDLVSVQTPTGVKTMTYAEAKKLGAK